MLLRGEYLYSMGKYEDISFNFVLGLKAEYKKWMEGYRIKVEGNNVSCYKATDGFKIRRFCKEGLDATNKFIFL